ncbi:MAG: L-serine ammonia-lyase, iron-sulfur-dependent, subunit alpha [Candidatus Aerophobetes bacterium]|nr:L-serine ammonia-lyase, iron-sulfur-dependent, subunit alpha [Candidatus Aerophobetes bacterium]
MEKNNIENTLLAILREQVKPALGCTEPIAVALAAATAKKYISGNIEKISVVVDKNVYKNGARVRVPGTKMTGLDSAAALGAICGNPDKGLEVLEAASEKDVEIARRYLRQKRIKVKLDREKNILYIRVKIVSPESYAICTIEKEHTNITFIETDGRIIKDNKSQTTANEVKNEIQNYSLKDFKKFADTVELEDAPIVKKALEINSEIGLKGMENKENFAYQLRESLIEEGENPEKSVFTYPGILAGAGVYERMSGAKKPVMIVAGSGNHGLAATLPLVAIKRIKKFDNEKLFRAIILSCLITIYIKSFTGVLSPICGAGVVAGSAVSGAITYMMGGTVNQIRIAVNNSMGTLAGMVCDGGKRGCALKISGAVSVAVEGALLALHNIGIPDKEGIVRKDVEETIKNLGYLSKKGMSPVDTCIIDILSGEGGQLA